MQMKTALLFIIVSLAMTSIAVCQSDVRNQQQVACEDDAFRLCNDAIPDEARVYACMAAQKSKLSPGCRVWFQSSSRRRHSQR
jgi:hypothetical protein